MATSCAAISGALAAAMASLINILDPECIILAGGIARAGDALFDPLNRCLDQFKRHPGNHRVRIVPATLGDHAGALGAARIALDSL